MQKYQPNINNMQQPKPMPKPVAPIEQEPMPMPKPIAPVEQKPMPKPVVPIEQQPMPKPIAPVEQKPMPMPKPVAPVEQKPCPMPKPMAPAEQKPCPMPKPVKPFLGYPTCPNPNINQVIPEHMMNPFLTQKMQPYPKSKFKHGYQMKPHSEMDYCDFNEYEPEQYQQEQYEPEECQQYPMKEKQHKKYLPYPPCPYRPDQYQMQQTQQKAAVNMTAVLEMIKQAVEGEKEDRMFYDYLIKNASNPKDREMISGIRDDEIRHAKMFRQLYYEHTGQTLKPVDEVYFERPRNYCEGLIRAYMGEQNAIRKYRNILFAMRSRSHINILTEIITDEIRHATLYNLMIHNNDCKY